METSHDEKARTQEWLDMIEMNFLEALKIDDYKSTKKVIQELRSNKFDTLADTLEIDQQNQIDAEDVEEDEPYQNIIMG